ncbi:MAG: T9SS type A sorting domain-containing protein [Cyclobacteriaceae bacterium]|nr:T9SS type A sorting domain-containing protein [Cyclobacteriaceae bacterium]
MKRIWVIVLFIIVSALAVNAQNSPSTEFPNVKKQSLKQPFDVELFPNPSVDFLNISVSDPELKNPQFDVYTVIGNKLTFQVEQQGSTKYKINVQDFSPGYYLLIVRDPVTRANRAFKFRKL